MTLKPASSAALAISKCVWLGVATVTKSIRSSAGSFSSRGQHLAIRAVGPLRAECRSRRPRPWPSAGSRRQRAGDQRGAVVEHGGRAVHAADERALAAADQAHAQFSIQRAIGRHVRFAPGLRPNRPASARRPSLCQHAIRAPSQTSWIRRPIAGNRPEDYASFLTHQRGTRSYFGEKSPRRAVSGFRRPEAVRSITGAAAGFRTAASVSRISHKPT